MLDAMIDKEALIEAIEERKIFDKEEVIEPIGLAAGTLQSEYIRQLTRAIDVFCLLRHFDRMDLDEILTRIHELNRLSFQVETARTLDL